MADDNDPRSRGAEPGANPQHIFLTPETPPEHRPGFWSDLERSMAAETPVPTVLVSSNAADAKPATRPRGWALLAAAATALVLVGLAVGALRGDDPGPSVTTELAVDPPDDTAPALDGPDDAASVETPAPEPAADASGDPAPAAADGTTVDDPSPPATSEVPRALGAAPGTIYLAQDGDIPPDARFLATWESRRLSWYSVADDAKPCTDLAHAEIRYVNESGITQAVHDPQVGFSGDVSHFVVDPAEQRAGWLVSCGTQLEFYVGVLRGTGELEDPTLVWFGEGDAAGALIVWEQHIASLNFVDRAGTPVYVDYDTRTELASGTGINPAPSEPGSPPGRGSIPLAASGDALFSYWTAPTRSFADTSSGPGACDTEALWVRQPGPRWTVALVEDLELRSIDVVALSADASKIAFADSGCDGRDGRFFVGIPGGDGLIRDITAIDLAPFVPGFADRLFWVDPTTLRIETDNGSVGVDRVRFDYRLGDDTESGVMVLLD